ncbi:MAG: DUF4442 domain-containing protein [Actinobacteria bacterium]|nr:DUF4442 domain-containing protein [Actinomycetota bacterium]
MDITSAELTPTALTAAMRATTPLIDTLSIEVLEVGERVRLRIPNEVQSRNHMGGPHAGAIFTLGESTAACLMLTKVGHLLDRGKPLAVSATVSWSKLARCAVLSEATMDIDAAQIEREFLDGGRPEWTTTILFTREDDGAPCGEMSVVLTLVHPRVD